MADNGPNVSEGAASVADGVAAMELGLEDALQGVYTNQQHKYSQRTLIKTILSTGTMLADKKLVVGGWVKTGRVAGGGAFGFLELNDGSCASSLQVIIDKAVYPLGKLTPTGTSITVVGTLAKTPPGTKQEVELRALKVIHVGSSDPSTYPIAKTKLSLEFLRSVQHLRARTNTISAIARIRSSLAFATHKFFNEHGFMYIHTPLITTSDAEGAGELFQVTTLLNKLSGSQEAPPTEEELEAAEAAVAAKGDQVRALKEKKEKSKVKVAVSELTALKEKLEELKKRYRVVGGLLRKDDGGVDYVDDFFGRQAFLTVSGQLQVETYAAALSNVYTFGPTFRAENSNTTRHLAEFWMIEPEIAFADLTDDMQLAEDYVRYLCQYLLDHCAEDLELMRKLYDKTCIDRLTAVASTPFGRVSYTEAIDILLKVKKEEKEFENKVEWGIDMASEHERYLAEIHFKKPVIVYNYPKDIKAFYMRLNDDKKTVAAMDVLVPGVGELVGGSQREERLEVLEDRLKEMGLPREPYEWYLETRKYGTVKHAGFGLGFERMILFATGMENIRDVIPFPRYPGRADL